jgi:hypothetical protein
MKRGRLTAMPPTRKRVGKPFVVIELPTNSSFRTHAVHDFNATLGVFNWSLKIQTC